MEEAVEINLNKLSLKYHSKKEMYNLMVGIGLYQSLEFPQKVHSYKSRVRSRVYIVGQYIEGSRKARKSTVYPSPAYIGIGRGSGVSLFPHRTQKLPITSLYDSILNPLT